MKVVLNNLLPVFIAVIALTSYVIGGPSQQNEVELGGTAVDLKDNVGPANAEIESYQNMVSCVHIDSVGDMVLIEP